LKTSRYEPVIKYMTIKYIDDARDGVKRNAME